MVVFYEGKDFNRGSRFLSTKAMFVFSFLFNIFVSRAASSVSLHPFALRDVFSISNFLFCYVCLSCFWELSYTNGGIRRDAGKQRRITREGLNDGQRTQTNNEVATDGCFLVFFCHFRPFFYSYRREPYWVEDCMLLSIFFFLTKLLENNGGRDEKDFAMDIERKQPGSCR